MDKLLVLLTVLFLLSCNSEKGKAYFDFDKLNHFSIEKSSGKLMDLRGQENLSEDDKMLIDVMLANESLTLSDATFLNSLNRLGFTEKAVDANKLDGVRDLFSVQEVNEILQTKCVAVYRDILVFEKEEEVVGIAKVCFECEKHHIIGSIQDTETFGQNNDYSKLEELLKE